MIIQLPDGSELGCADAQPTRVCFRDGEALDAILRGDHLALANEIPLAGSSLLGIVSAHFNTDQTFPTFDITPFVAEETNTLYLYESDLGAFAGLMFSATIVTVPDPPPVPALNPLGIALLLAALGATAYRRLRGSASAA